MTVDDLIQALGLPESTRLNQRVPKKLLAEQDVATPADRRQIQDGVDEVVWLAALKPHLIGVPAYEDHDRQYLELAVLHLTLKPGSKPGRLVELLHRAVPYPVMLFTDADASISISLAHLRRSQNEAEKTVLDGELLAVTFPTETQRASYTDFCAAFPLAQQPQALHRQRVHLETAQAQAVLVHAQAQASADGLPAPALGLARAEVADLEDVGVVPAFLQRRVAEDEFQRR